MIPLRKIVNAVCRLLLAVLLCGLFSCASEKCTSAYRCECCKIQLSTTRVDGRPKQNPVCPKCGQLMPLSSFYNQRVGMRTHYEGSPEEEVYRPYRFSDDISWLRYKQLKY